ncbi:MAG: GntR family transcriptional regulator [Kiritimatiellae bacterium]|nr:GntR family transcriptional regulator [Kiritimatiellia bacterium]
MKAAQPPIYRTIADDLTAEIRAGRLRPGDRLPGHVKLARAHGVSVITSNRALAELEQRGLVERRPRQGTFVREQPRALRWILVPTSGAFQRDCPQVLDYLDGVLTETDAHGVEVRLEPAVSRFLRTPEAIRALDCQAVIQLGHPPADAFPYHTLRLSNLPWVGVGVQEGPAGYFVNEDRLLGARLLVEAMRADGCERVGFIANLARPNHRLARDGYIAATSDTGLEASLVRDADATTVIDNVKALVPRIDGLIIVGIMGIAALSYLRGTDQTLPLGLFMENKDMLAFQPHAYFVQQPHVEVGREAVRLLLQAVEGRVTGPACRLVKPTVTRPSESAAA